jgi:hypothetical protein
MFGSLHAQELPLADLQDTRVREQSVRSLQHFTV